MTNSDKAKPDALARELLSIFIMYIVTSLTIYAIFLRYIVEYKYDVPGGGRVVTTLLILALTTVCVLAIKRSPCSLDKFGVTLVGWQAALKAALGYSIPVLALITLAKYVALQVSGSEAALFDPTLSYSKTGSFNQTMYLLALAGYLVTSPLQEVIVRGTLQSFLQLGLVSNKQGINWRAIVLSNLIFAMCHAHIRLSFVLAAFLPGIFWGWLYAKYGTLIAPIVSHLVIGIYLLFVLGTGGLI